MQIFVTVSGAAPGSPAALRLDVEASETIENVIAYAKIQSRITTPIGCQMRLIGDCRQLALGCTLSDYNIQHESTLHLVHHEGAMQIFVKTLTEHIYPMNVKASDTIHDVKTKIQDKFSCS